LGQVSKDGGVVGVDVPLPLVSKLIQSHALTDGVVNRSSTWMSRSSVGCGGHPWAALRS
jgi:hypothetical protein